MYTGLLLHTHSSLRYLVLLFLLIVIVKSIIGWTGKKPFAKIDNTFSLVLLIVTHLQFVAGLVLYFVSPKVSMDGAMTDIYRYFTVEHASAMILAVGLITGARSASKKAVDDERKFKILAIFNLIALAVIVITLLLGKLNVFGPGASA